MEIFDFSLNVILKLENEKCWQLTNKFILKSTNYKKRNQKKKKKKFLYRGNLINSQKHITKLRKLKLKWELTNKS